MPKRPEHFPHDSKPEDIKHYMADLMHNLPINTTDRFVCFTEYQLGQNELQNRQIKKINKTTRLLSYLSIGISIMSLIVVSVFSILSYKSSKNWETSQLNLLNQAISSFDGINNNMNKQSKIIADSLHKNEKAVKEILDNLKRGSK